MVAAAHRPGRRGARAGRPRRADAAGRRPGPRGLSARRRPEPHGRDLQRHCADRQRDLRQLADRLRGRHRQRRHADLGRRQGAAGPRGRAVDRAAALDAPGTGRRCRLAGRHGAHRGSRHAQPAGPRDRRRHLDVDGGSRRACRTSRIAPTWAIRASTPPRSSGSSPPGTPAPRGSFRAGRGGSPGRRPALRGRPAPRSARPAGRRRGPAPARRASRRSGPRRRTTR